MSTADIDYRIAKLETKPGDILVFTTPRMLSAEMADHLRKYVARVLPDIQVLVVGGGADVSLLTREELAGRLEGA